MESRKNEKGEDWGGTDVFWREKSIFPWSPTVVRKGDLRGGGSGRQENPPCEDEGGRDFQKRKIWSMNGREELEYLQREKLYAPRS